MCSTSQSCSALQPRDPRSGYPLHLFKRRPRLCQARTASIADSRKTIRAVRRRREASLEHCVFARLKGELAAAPRIPGTGLCVSVDGKSRETRRRVTRNARRRHESRDSINRSVIEQPPGSSLRRRRERGNGIQGCSIPLIPPRARPATSRVRNFRVEGQEY